MMNVDSWAAAIAGIVGAVVVSAAALYGAAVGGDEGMPTGAMVEPFFIAVHFIGFAMILPAALALRARYRGALGRIGRVAAAAFPASFAAMIVAYLAWPVLGEPGFVSALASVGFLGMFVSALVLGVALWRRTDASRLGALLLVAPVPLIPIVMAIDALGLVPAHPGAMEAAVYLGVATFGYERLTRPEQVDAVVRPAVG
jgi:hypothetical protein